MYSPAERLSARAKRATGQYGFPVVVQETDWSFGLERLRELDGPLNFYNSNRDPSLSVRNAARGFDPHKFVL